MTYIGVIASAILHVGGLFLLLTARAPDPLIPLGTDSPVAVDIISLDEYNALVSRAPSGSTLAALRTQPEPPRPPVVTDADPVVDTLEEETPLPVEPEPTTQLAMRLPPEIQDAPPEPEVEEPPAPETSDVEIAPPPDPLALDADALRDRGVDPADLIPNDDVKIAVAPPAPKPPRGVFDAPLIDTDPDEPPTPNEPEGDGEEQAKPAPEPEPMVEKPVETAKAEDLAPLTSPLPVMKPRGSLAVASEEEPEPVQVAEAPPPAPTPPQPPVVEPRQPTPEPEPVPDLQLTEAELEEERQMMAALMEQMRANQPPTEAELRAAEEEARRKFAEEQQRLAELAALDDAERRRREEADRARAAAEAANRARAEAEAAAEAEIERRAQELADAQAREIAALRQRDAEQLRAQQQAALRAQQELEEARRRQAAEEAQRVAREQYERQQAEEAARQQDLRDRAARRQQLAELNANIAPEARANNVITGTAPSTPSQSPAGGGLSALDRVFAAANVAAGAANTGSSFGRGGGGNQGASLTANEMQAVLNQLRRCWRVDTFSANANSLVVTLRAQIRQNGFVNQATIDIVSPNPVPAEYQIAADRARTALQDLRCQPFSLPANKYNAWRDIVIRFDPAQMVLQ